MEDTEPKPIRWPIHFIMTQDGREICIDCANEKGITGVYISLEPSWQGKDLWVCEICGKRY
jgi:hypothetical protein